MKKNHWLDYLFLFLLLIGSLWQVAFLQATMKWDIMDITLPWNYFITECLANGELPMWNPFINGGFAQMGINDTWNPITWLIGSILGYDPVVIQFQYLGHLFLGGVGFYHLGKFFGWIRTIGLVTASCFMLSGFMIGNAQHLGWVVGASWLPWIFLNYKKWEKNPSVTAAIILAVVSALMFLSSYPGIFIAMAYLLFGLFIFKIIQTWRKKDFVFFKKIIQSAFISGIAFLLLTLVAWVSMWRLSGMINRGESLPIESALYGSLPWEAITTFLFPSATTAGGLIWESDVTLVNCYFGLIPFSFLLFYFIQSFFQKIAIEFHLPTPANWGEDSVKLNQSDSDNLQSSPPLAGVGGWNSTVFHTFSYFLLGSLFFGIAMGKDLPLRHLIYEVIPLMDIFRLPSYFRIFGIFFFLIASGFALNYFFTKENKQYIYKYIIALGVLILGISFWAKNKTNIDGGAMVERNGKWELLPDAQFFSNIGLQGLMHFMLLLMLGLGLIFLKKRSFQNGLLLAVVSLDLFFAVQLNVSATVVQYINPQTVNAAFYKHSPKEYPHPPLDRPFKDLHRVANFDFVHLHVNLNHFHKIPTPDGASPIHFKWANEANEDGFYKKTIQYPLIFAASEISQEGILRESSIDTLSFEKLKIINFTPNQMEVETNFSEPMVLVYLQNHHPDWRVFINGEKSIPTMCNKIYLSTPIPKGKNIVRFSFEPKVEKMTFYGSVVSWLAVSLFLITMLFRRKMRD